MTASNVAPTPTSSTGGGVLKGCGLIVAIGVAILFVLALFLYLQLQSWYRKPEGVPVDAIWRQAAVSLPADRPATTGRFTITAAGQPAPGTRFVMTIGVPEAASSGASTAPAPAELLGAPAVRLAVTLGPGATLACVAPCELDLSGSIPACDGGTTCRHSLDVRVERLGEASTAEALALTVHGGVSAPLRQALPDGTAVELAFDEPTASGGG